MEMKQVIVGVYEAGYDQIELVLREGTGGEFYIIPEKGGIPRIKIGADCKEWIEVVDTLLHEIYEHVFDRLRCRYEISNQVTTDHSAYLFSFSHNQFCEACCRVSEFITNALPDLAKAWEAWRKEKTMKNLEEYLRENINKQAIDHSIRAQIDNNGSVSFYIHPANISGDTLDFEVKENQLIPKR